MLILDVTDPNSVKKNTFLEIGWVNDIAFYNSAYDSHKYAILATRKGICLLCLQDPTHPMFAGRYDTRSARGVAISSDSRYAFVADGDNGLVIIDIQDPTGPTFVGDYNTWYAQDVALSSDDRYTFVADGYNGLVVLQIIDTSQSQGNLILCPSGPTSSKNPLWAPSQAVANLAYSTFLDQNYPHYFTYYLNPNRYQDIDGDGIPNPFTVDDFDPTVSDLTYTLNNWAYNRLNEGPLYLYFTGLGTEDAYQIMPGQIIKSQDPNDPIMKR